MRRVFNKMRRFGTIDAVLLSVIFAFMIGTIILTTPILPVEDWSFFKVFASVFVYVSLFTGIYSLVSFERMQDSNKELIDRLREENEYLRDLLIERDNMMKRRY